VELWSVRAHRVIDLRDDKDQSPRSVYNKFESVMAFLKLQGMTSKRDADGTMRPLVSKNDWPPVH
jgi:hypothetical protein